MESGAMTTIRIPALLIITFLNCGRNLSWNPRIPFTSERYTGWVTNLSPKAGRCSTKRCEVSMELTTTENVKSTMVCTLDQDMALVHACKDGDAAAFEQLVKRYDARLLRIAQHITHNREDAQDAVQEAFLKVFRKLAQFQENSQFSTWLIRITVNESLMKLRKQRSNREVSFDEDFQSEEHIAAFELADWTP